MTTYSAISNASVAVGGIPSSATVTALRDNPIAIAESSSGAPVVAAGWHPVSKVTVGDGQAGLLYDFAVSGAQATVTTPDFEDGYEYRIVCADIQHNAGASVRFQVNAYYQTDAAYQRVWYTVAGGSTARFGVDMEFLVPRVTKRGHFFRAIGFLRSGTTTTVIGEAYLENTYVTTAQKILRAQMSFESGSIAGGQIWLMRRREYISSP